MIELKIALKNLFRNKRRTILTFLIICFSYVSLVVFGSYVNKTKIALRDYIIQTDRGHLTIVKKGYYDSKDARYSPDFLMDNSMMDSVKRAIEETQKEMGGEIIRTVSPRIYLQGLIAAGDNSTIFQGMSIDPNLEGIDMETSGTFTNVDSTKLFTEKVNIPLPGGQKQESYKSSAIIGEELAKYLKAKPGDDITLLVSINGSQEAWNLKLAGISNFGVPEYNEIRVVTDIDSGKQLYYEDKAHAIVVMLEDIKYLDKFEKILKSRIDNNNVEIKDWTYFGDFYYKVVNLYDTQYYVTMSILLIVIIISVGNVMSMSVTERVPEFGTIRAVGISKVEVFRMITFEGILLGIISILISVVVAYIAMEVINKINMPLPPPPAMNVKISFSVLQDPIIYLTNAIYMIVVVSFSSIPASLYALKINIANAIRYS